MRWLWATVRCPFCFATSALGDCAIVSSSSGATLWTPGLWRRLLGRIWPRSLDDPYFAEQAAVRQCPRCESGLPRNSGAMRNRTIAIVGPPGSGKTHLLAALLYQLDREAALTACGATVAAVDEQMQVRIDDGYCRPLFSERRVLPPTAELPEGEIHRPLIYEVLFRRGRSIRGFNLALFDAPAAGEAILSQPHIVNADGLLFLVEPWSLPGMARAVPRRRRPLEVSPVDSAVHLLNQTTERFWRRGGRSRRTVIDVPLAVVISKADVLSGAGYSWPAAGADRDIRELVARLGGQAILDATRPYARCRFYAASATGGPEGPDGVYRGVTPSGCIDPLLGVLKEVEPRVGCHGIPGVPEPPRD